MAAYLIVRVTITDPEKFGEYLKHSPRLVGKVGGRYLARGGEVTTLEGPEETNRMVVLEFPSAEVAKDFYHSEEYGMVKALREGAGDASFVVVDGLEDGAWEAIFEESNTHSLG